MNAQQTSLSIVPEFSIRLIRESRTRFYGQQIGCPDNCFTIFREAFTGLDREHFTVVCLNPKHKPIGFNVVAIGSLTMALIHPREVFKLAVIQNAASIILMHNHPSGDPTPSQADMDLTRRLVQCGNLLDIKVIDHLVFGDKIYYSFAAQDMIRDGNWNSLGSMSATKSAAAATASRTAPSGRYVRRLERKRITTKRGH